MNETQKTYIRKWLIKAENELISAKNDLSNLNPITKTVCFHARQCAEKSLKAFIAFKEIHVEKAFTLTRLLGICEAFDETFSEFADAAAKLTDYGVSTRYPGDWREIPVDEAEEAVVNAQNVFDYVKKKLEKYL